MLFNLFVNSPVPVQLEVLNDSVELVIVGFVDRWGLVPFLRRFLLLRIEGMLHELLLALVGYTGDLIVDERVDGQFLEDSKIAEECTFKLASDLNFIETSERFSSLNPNFLF